MSSAMPSQADEPSSSKSDDEVRRSDNRGRTPTIRDVAALAGVSIGTVSKSLNGREGISSRTRATVLEAAEQLGFHSNALARNLLTGRSCYGADGSLPRQLFGHFVRTDRRLRAAGCPA